MLFQTSIIYRFGIVLTLLFIFLVPLLSSTFVDIFWGFAVLTLGILHGANDLEIIAKNFNGRSKYLFIKSISLYIAVVLLGGFFFFTLPAAALLVFILFSSYHFGEQHWEGRLPHSVQTFLFYTLYGAFIFFLIFSFQYESVVLIIEQISNRHFDFPYFLNTTLALGGMLMLFMAVVPQLRRHFVQECLLLVLLGVLFSVGSLLFAFAFYFVIWHSLPSLRDQLEFLYGSMSFRSFGRYLKSSALYWMAALVTLFLVYRYIDFQADYFMPLFFSFLAAITFPHTVVMGLMKHQNGSTD